MAAHTPVEFATFMSQLKETNQTLDFFCDFDKIHDNVEDIKLSLCMLNSLIGAADMQSAVETIWRRDKSAFNVMDILIAVRSEGKKKVLNSLGECVVLDSLFESVDGVMEFLNDTGLAEVFQSQKITNLVDYVFGVETGLDSNARKNRSGHVMENVVAEIFENNGVDYRTEVYSREWAEMTKALGDDEKRFDFVIETPQKIYLIEVNFYSGGGSKLNEVARAYSDIAPKINAVDGFEFVWITDGIGWNSAKNKLQEAFNIIPSIYNLSTIEHFISQILTI
ncbi:MAG: type II restriction endonuclease [Paludibacteraceae bacterium]